MAATAQYIATPRSTAVEISAANAAYTGAGTIVTVFTAGPSGARIERVSVSASANTAAGVVGLFVGTDSAANTTANTHLYDTIPVTAVTASATVAPFAASRSEANANDKWPLILGPGQTLRASTTIAQSFRVTAVGGDY